jgi:hypothetical protein
MREREREREREKERDNEWPKADSIIIHSQYFVSWTVS